MKAYYKTLDTHIRKMDSIADVTAEILQFKNCSVGNFVECMAGTHFLSFADCQPTVILMTG